MDAAAADDVYKVKEEEEVMEEEEEDEEEEEEEEDDEFEDEERCHFPYMQLPPLTKGCTCCGGHDHTFKVIYFLCSKKSQHNNNLKMPKSQYNNI